MRDHRTHAIDRDGLAEARRFGWVYEYQGRVVLTGAASHHPGKISFADETVAVIALVGGRCSTSTDSRFPALRGGDERDSP
jgi:hypothetical protein